MGEQMRVDPRAVAAVAGRLDAAARELRAAGCDATDTRFGPDSAPHPVRVHAVDYAAGTAGVAQIISALATSVADLATDIDSAAMTLGRLDASVADHLRAAGDRR